ncbi:hypothetical protein [Allorhizocola rhizosphaerae]|uniref:hypothetical protein n=1 Tax=Allorhizocola rhizosphaerae TaxID=1872709 RepID=UPI000E3D7796|nr:hypothetical protein [Allorhizocola rhizosphaerae]
MAAAILHALVSQVAIWNAVKGTTNPLFVLYAVQVLGLGSGVIGVLFMIRGAGAVLGAAAVPMLLGRRLASLARPHLGDVSADLVRRDPARQCRSSAFALAPAKIRGGYAAEASLGWDE